MSHGQFAPPAEPAFRSATPRSREACQCRSRPPLFADPRPDRKVPAPDPLAIAKLRLSPSLATSRCTAIQRAELLVLAWKGWMPYWHLLVPSLSGNDSTTSNQILTVRTFLPHGICLVDPHVP